MKKDHTGGLLETERKHFNFTGKFKDLTIDVIHNIIHSLHDSFTTYDYDKISDISGINILNDAREIKELFKRRKEEVII